MKKKLVEYCVGCGACRAYSKAEIQEDEKGFLYPTSGDINWLKNICPIGNIPVNLYDSSSIWGRQEGLFFGWSNNKQIRTRASSGGIITEIACYLLDKHTVDGVIHICADPNKPTATMATVSITKGEVIAKSGSRYAISHPLEIIKTIDLSKKYAFIGKPCDVIALRNLQSIDQKIKESITVLIAFFCMGLPSADAQKRLLTLMKIEDDKCEELSYRGNGWPGYATGKDNTGKIAQVDYNTAWGSVLGRDVMSACHFCIDGIGEAADISCGDGWYLKEDGRPDFTEHEGRNIVFARTNKGLAILKAAIEEERISLESIKDSENYLKAIQWSQYYRRASLQSRILALRVTHRQYPHYPSRLLHDYEKSISVREKMKVFLGTCKRIYKGKI